MSDNAARIDNMAVSLRRLLAEDDLVALSTFDMFGGLAAVEYFADSTSCHPDQRGRIAATVEVARRRLTEPPP